MPPARVAVAVSGGRDSTALLHCTVRQAQALGAEVIALHVHHGLLPQADAWLDQVRRQSRRWGAAFASRQLCGAPARGESVEAWARAGRYQALTEMAGENNCDLVLLAHHRRDQAETWLLQALRGAGAAGLAAMPAVAQRQAVTWARPWLDQPAQAIEAYARRHRIKHVQDPSNADLRFARSRLRHAVWPALTAAFADAETSLAAAAARARESQALAQEVARMDLPALVSDGRLAVAPWLQLPPARRMNALRAWLLAQLGAPPHSLVERLLAELPWVRQGSWPAPGARLRLYRGWLAVASPPTPVDSLHPASQLLDLSRAGKVSLPSWRGHWRVQSVREGGVVLGALKQVLVHARQGGESLRIRPSAAARSLKKQFQALAVPAWERQGPLLSTAAGVLIFVPGLGPDAAFQAAPGQPQRLLVWVPDPLQGAGRRQHGG